MCTVGFLKPGWGGMYTAHLHLGRGEMLKYIFKKCGYGFCLKYLKSTYLFAFIIFQSQRHTETEIFHPLVHSPFRLNSHSCTKLNPRDGTAFWCPM